MQTKKLQFISVWKTELISSVVVAICLFLVYLFPVQNVFQNSTRSLFFLAILPVLYIKFILKKDLADYGFNLENKKTGFLWALGMFAVSFLLIFLLIRFKNFDKIYLIPAYLANNFGLFLFYELALVNFLLFINEFFFKGFLLFTLAQKIGLWSVLIQALVYILFILAVGDLAWQIAPMLILSITGGIATYKSKSFVYSYLMSLAFLIILDSYIIYIFK